MSYFADVKPLAKKEGKKIKRMGMRKNSYFLILDPKQVTVKIGEASIGLHDSNCLLLVDPKERQGKDWIGEGNVLGYELTKDDKISCDWEVVEDEV